jgi:hypothetical protein
MPAASEAGYTSRFASALRRWLRRLLVAIVIFFALIGAVTATIYLTTWATEGRWTIVELQALFVFDEKRQQTLQWLWDGGNRALRGISFLLIAGALFIAAIRLTTIAKIIRDFVQGRGAIYTLQTTIIGVSETVQRLSHLEPTIQLLNEKIDAAQEQVAELQRYTASQQAQAGGTNWEKLRELWYANTRRIDGVIDRISNPRRKQRYRKMPRSNYTPIIQALAKDELISRAAEDASIKLDADFKAYLSGEKTLTDEAVAGLIVYDGLLEEQLSTPAAGDEDDAQPTV